MRLWTLHPKYLDAKGLVAAWREGLLAQKVLAGKTTGYRHHPQLIRFRAHDDPPAAIAAYLHGLLLEARRRGYRFDESKIVARTATRRITETRGQVMYEWEHLKRKLRARAPERLRGTKGVKTPELHLLFRLRAGGVREWENR